MDPAEKTMYDNLHLKTGKTLEEWIAVVQAKNLSKHGEIVNFLKSEHGLGHGYANMVAHKTLGSDSGSVADKDSLVDQQYKGKEQFRPLYDHLLQLITDFGDDVDISPKNAYVSLRRKKQFAILQPATKTRFEIQLNLKGQPEEGLLKAITGASAMCSHKISIASVEELTPEVLQWLKLAYDRAG